MSERAKIVFEPDRARDILYGSDKSYKVIKDELVDSSRWSLQHDLVIQSVTDGRFWKGYYSVGATECQDESAFEYTTPEFVEVFPTEQVVIVYK